MKDGSGKNVEANEGIMNDLRSARRPCGTDSAYQQKNGIVEATSREQAKEIVGAVERRRYLIDGTKRSGRKSGDRRGLRWLHVRNKEEGEEKERQKRERRKRQKALWMERLRRLRQPPAKKKRY